MTKVIGVRFRTAGKIYFFDPLQFEIKRGDHVIVETARGIEFGTVVSGVREVEDDKVVQPLKPVIRIANQRDVEQEQENRRKEKDAFQICLEKIQKHGLEMKLIDAEYTFDNNKVLFYFTADGRIDFRELVKDLASVFKTRIELRQIGVRDETKIIGGIGICGRALCCHSYLSDFVPVSIKMAKEQNLSLNPTKISGVCGRLMCCLKNEEETYEELNRRLPSIGDLVTAEDGCRGEVQSVNVLRQLVKVVVEEGDSKEIREYEVGKLHFKRKHTKKERMELSPEELRELERLEEEELEEIRAEEKEEGRQERSRREGGSQESRQERGRREDGSQENRQERGRREDGSQENRQERSRREDGSQENRQERGRREGNWQESRQDNANRAERRRERGSRNSSFNERRDNFGERRDNHGDKRRNYHQESRRDGHQNNSRQNSFTEERSNDQRHFKRERRSRSGRKPGQNGNAGSSSES